MKLQIAFSTVVAVVLSGCAQVALDVPPDQAGRVPMMDGRPVLISKKRNTAFVSFSHEAFPSGQRGIVNLAVKNGAGKPFNVGPENVQVVADGGPADERRIVVREFRGQQVVVAAEQDGRPESMPRFRARVAPRH
jgi:hypothetical protein